MSLVEIQERISKAEIDAGRAPGSTELIAVSKVQPNERVQSVLEQGHRVFGENKVQEAAGKWPGFRETYDGVSVHLLGPLQTNKARQAMELFEVIHSLDRPKLANTLARLAQELGKWADTQPGGDAVHDASIMRLRCGQGNGARSQRGTSSTTRRQG